MASNHKNRLILSAVKALAPRHISHELKKILVVSTTALGDTLWATPALANLRAAHPHAHLAVLTSPIGSQALQHNPSIDQLIVLKDPLLPRFWPLLRTLKKVQFDVALIFHTSQRLALPLCALSGIPRIIGTPGINKGLDGLLTQTVEPCFEHEIERRLRIAETLGAPRKTETLSYFVQPHERMTFPDNRLRIALHPGSKEPFRRWPPHYFAAVARELQKRFDCDIYLTGTPDERPILDEIVHLLPSAQIFNGSLRQLGAFLEQIDLLLSNDTGPFHLACALNRPAVGLYVSTDPRFCGPYKAPLAKTISRPLTCDPCLKRKCREPFCFLQIPPSEVIDACSSFLKTQ